MIDIYPVRIYQPSLLITKAPSDNIWTNYTTIIPKPAQKYMQTNLKYSIRVWLSQDIL